MKDQRNSTRIFMIGILMLFFHFLGAIYPEQFWSTNSFGLLDNSTKVFILIVALFFFSTPFWWKAQLKENAAKENGRKQKNLFFMFGALIVAIVYAQMPMAADYYGDAIYIKKAINTTIPEWDDRLLTELLTPNWLDTKSGLKTYYEINNLFTWMSGKNGTVVAQGIGAIMGGMFAFIWMKFVDLHLTKTSWKALFIVVGLTSPLTAVFMGHYESYLFSYTALLIWMSALGIYFKTESRKWLIALPFIFLFVVQTHITNWILFPSMVIAFLWHYRGKWRSDIVIQIDENVQKLFKKYKGGITWSGVILYVFVPALLIGLYAYFKIYENHDGPRQFSMDEFEDTLFLPLYTDEPAPYDRYNLFSLSHILDYFNLLLMWSGAILLLLLPPLTIFRKKIPWNNPLILVSGSTAILFFIAYFILNPLLGPVIDWDLFSTPGIIVLPFLVFVYAHLEDHIQLKSFAGPVLGLCLFGLSFIIVNSKADLLSNRLKHIGSYNYKTYWIGSSTAMIASTELNNNANKGDKLQQLITELRDHAIKGNDKEYAALHLEKGRYERKENGDLNAALYHFDQANRYSPRLSKNIYYLTITNFEAGNYTESNKFADQLVELKYSPFQNTLRMAIHISLAAEEYQSAANHAVAYLANWPDDKIIVEVEHRLRTGDRIETIVDLFASSK